jgi:hypothetical protein
MWGVGLIFGEMWKRKPLLPGANELEQIELIFNLVGIPTERSWPEYRNLHYFKAVESVAKRLPSLSDKFPSARYN